jgi:phenylpropionate dioxygenase-like ring-hydroxylating dioxygenase large terminal subunit
MLMTEEPIFRRFWYATVQLAALDAGPQAFTLLGEDIVLWKRQDGTPAALEDKCPHRSVKLSVDSLIVDDTLRCGYHGWRFDGAGTCVLVPQAPDTTPPARNAVKSYHCTARYGFVWVCLEEPVRDIPDLPYATDPGFRQIIEYEQDWQANALRICENALDTAHVSFVHRGTFGADDDPVAPPFTLFDVDDGIGVASVLPVVNRSEQQRNLNIAAERTTRDMRMRWLMPATFILHLTYPNGLVQEIVSFVTPISDQVSRRIHMSFRNDTEADAPAAGITAYDMMVAAEDRVLLETCGPDYPIDLHAEAHMWLDQATIGIRKAVADWLASPPEARARETVAA